MVEISKLGKSLDSLGGTPQLLAAGSLLFLSAAALRQYVLSYKLPNGCAEVSGTLGALPRIWRAVRKSAVHDELVEVYEEMGDTVFLSFGLLRYFLNPIVATRDARNVEHMLKKNFQNYPKGELAHGTLHDLLGEGIFNADGSSWMAQRKTASQMFTANRFKNHIWCVVEKNIGKVLKVLDSASGAIDIFNLMNRFTLDSIGEIGFGTSIGSLEHPESPFLKSFDEAQRVMFRRFIFPGWRLLRLLGLGFEKDSRHHIRVLKEYSSDLVEDLRGKLDTQAGDSFLGLFMKSRASGLPASKDFLIDMVLNFLIAGRDTTAQAMSWCFFLISQHPNVEAKILEEIQDVCGVGQLQYDHLSHFKYLEAVLNETLTVSVCTYRWEGFGAERYLSRWDLHQ